ncbi:hypothetical protein M0813_05239 [Anaeramoeba flamelloides]|uniref:Uncharacterized protein n=1 Tax=Anaeramoeba flamelloides TaxID=1746091 RepID=A0ABQ8XJ20_9EUKA|nr:hypothetical protein M0813_05239 [Anaeramoeba flamelloides]
MCFNQPISGAISILGILAAIYLRVFHWNKKGIWRLFYPTLYFTAMEILQFFMYFWIDDCSSPINIWLTIIGWLHICFQPVASNLMSTFTKSKEDKWYFRKMFLPLAWLGAIAGASRLFFYDWQPCDPIQDPLCGAQTCTKAGSVHLAWTLRLRAPNYFTPGGFVHALTMFVPPMLFDGFVPLLLMLVSGPFLAWYIGRDKDQFAAIWCYYSIFQVIVGLWINLTGYKDFMNAQKEEGEVKAPTKKTAKGKGKKQNQKRKLK